MCHQRPDRSFFIRGKQMPLCARCTGIAVGYILGIILLIIFRHIPYWLFLPLQLPAFIDGLVQLKTSYESKNYRRFYTGVLSGCGIIFFFYDFHCFNVFLAKAELAALLKA
jgi:uncharacterized membrane protein